MFGVDSAEWFAALGNYTAALPLNDPRLATAAEYLQPFLDDDDRIDCAMYLDGAAVRFLERAPWGGGHDEYLTGFIDALGKDWQRWLRITAAAGEAAEWRQS